MWYYDKIKTEILNPSRLGAEPLGLKDLLNAARRLGVSQRKDPWGIPARLIDNSNDSRSTLEEVSMKTRLEISVSVIIPVYNDAGRLRKCLKALATQTYPSDLYEVIVVDNGSSDLDGVKDMVATFRNVYLTYETTPGSYAARNRGLSLAKGEAVAFTDADCIPAEDWLEQGIVNLQSTPGCGQVVGRIEIFFADSGKPTMVELYDKVTAFPQQQLLHKHHGGATANVFTWRRVIDRVGNFNDHLKSHGDLEWGYRVYTHGYQQLYAASVLVRHPARMTLGELCIRTRRLAGGYYDLQLETAQTPWQRHGVFLAVLLQHMMPPVFFIINTFFDSRLQGLGQRLKVSFVMVIVRYVSAWEILRLNFGSVSRRA